ncbi:hypothetical protein [Nocardia sp. NPDC057030]|uniref:hypothetical protein n=1 Tax=unclassified Nocardia TaxID=2637762 RepID=UPI0036315527
MARAIALSYRSALHAENPQRCSQLDDAARQLGQHWIAPAFLPAHLVADAMEKEMSVVDIAHFWGIPANTIYGWVSKGLLRAANTDADGNPCTGRSAKYRVSDVFRVEGRNRVRQVDTG